jgi:hypothetical protein
MSIIPWPRRANQDDVEEALRSFRSGQTQSAAPPDIEREPAYQIVSESPLERLDAESGLREVEDVRTALDKTNA